MSTNTIVPEEYEPGKQQLRRNASARPRKPSRRRKRARKSQPAQGRSRQQKGRSNRHDEARQSRDVGRDHKGTEFCVAVPGACALAAGGRPRSAHLADLQASSRLVTQPAYRRIGGSGPFFNGTTKSAGWSVFLVSFLLFRSDGRVCRVFEGNQPSPCR